MKKVNILYWVFTGLFAAGMLFSAIPNILVTKDSVDFMTGFLKYPEYIIPFLGVAKLLGVITILIPGFPRLKEWAYAGLLFDLVGAVFSILAVGSPIAGMWPMALYFIFFAGSYVYYHKKRELAFAKA